MVKREELKIDIGEAVGVVAAQSIGEPGTQMSLPHDEKVIIDRGMGPEEAPIGELVDSLMEKFGARKVGDSEVCVLRENILVPSLKENGRIEWKRLLECSRHRCERRLVRIRTRSGRRITATENHSFVVRRDNAVVPVAANELKEGVRIPSVRRLPLPARGSSALLELSDYLPKDEYWFGSELAKAEIGGGHLVPVAREQLANHLKGASSNSIEDGYVYPYQLHGRARIPERMELDGELGWFIGAYLSEGNATQYYVNISNTDERFLSQARNFAKKLGLSCNEYDNRRGFSLGHDLRINSKVLSDFIARACGKGSAGKRVPGFAFGAGEGFVGALLRGYFEGDGNVSVSRRVVRVSSRSAALIDGIALLLARLGIFASKRKGRENTLSISYRYAQAFRKAIGFDSTEKRDALDRLCQLAEDGRGTSYDVVEMVPEFGALFAQIARKLGLPARSVNNFNKRQRVGRTTIVRFIRICEKAAGRGVEISRELSLLRSLYDEDVVWDEIAEIEYLPPSGEPVYDFSVEGLETFTTFEGIITHNTMRTFHYAGVAEQVPTGLPRLIEIVDVRREPKKPLMNIYLKGEFAKDEAKAKGIAEELEEVSLRKIAEIKESFARKEIEIIPDVELMRYEGLELDDVMKKIKAAAVGKADLADGKIIVKPKSTLLKAIRRTTGRLKELHLKGVKNIGRALVIREGEEHYIRTGGSNLEEVLKLPEVDARRVYTNNIKEIEKVLGIEAARNSIIFEAKQVLDMQKLDVDLRHIMLLADAMCMDGAVKPVGRHGLSGEKASILARAAFEETIKHLINASIKGEEDRLVGVTENIIIGQPIPMGTGTVRLSMKRGKK